MTLPLIEPVSLVGTRVSLQPASLDHAEAMHASADADTFRLFTRQPIPWSVESCRAHIQHLLDAPTIVPLSLFDAHTDELIGGTTYCDIRPEHRGLEIGWTWITPSRRGTPVNPEMKLLLLTHAFETDVFGPSENGGPAIRVMLKTHHKNVRSQAAILKLGAKHEGTMRNHVIMPDGSLRHTEVYSITPDEWPAIKQNLQDRLRTPS